MKIVNLAWEIEIDGVKTKTIVINDVIKLNSKGRWFCRLNPKILISRKLESLEQFTARCIEAGAVLDIHPNQN